MTLLSGKQQPTDEGAAAHAPQLMSDDALKHDDTPKEAEQKHEGQDYTEMEKGQEDEDDVTVEAHRRAWQSYGNKKKKKSGKAKAGAARSAKKNDARNTMMKVRSRGILITSYVGIEKSASRSFFKIKTATYPGYTHPLT